MRQYLKDNPDKSLDSLIVELQELSDSEPDFTPEPEQEPVPVFEHTVASVPVFIEVSGGYHKVEDFHAVNRLLKDGTSTEPEILHIARNSTVTIGMEQIEGVADQLVELGYVITGNGECGATGGCLLS